MKILIVIKKMSEGSVKIAEREMRNIRFSEKTVQEGGRVYHFRYNIPPWQFDDYKKYADSKKIFYRAKKIIDGGRIVKYQIYEA